MIFKKIVTYVIFGFFIYMGLILIFQVVTYLNKDGIEKELARQLRAENVSIGSILNFPFVAISLNDVEIQFGKKEKLLVQDASLFYNVVMLPFKGVIGSVYMVTINRANLTARWESIRDYYSENTDNANDAILQNSTCAYINSFKASLSYASGLNSEIEGKSVKISLRKGSVTLNTPASFEVLIDKNLVCFTADSYLRLDYDFLNFIGKGNIEFKRINVAGISDLESGNLPFIISNGILIDWNNSFVSKYVKQTNDGLAINFEKEFNLIYPDYNELYLLDHIFSAGEYRFLFSYNVNTNSWKLYSGVKSVSNKNYLYVNLLGKQKDILTKIELNSSKYGYGNFSVLFGKPSYPEGEAILTNLTIIPGLKISGKYVLENINNRLIINGYDTAINGGEVGNVHTILSLNTNGYIFSSDNRIHNAVLTGHLSENGYNFNITAFNVSAGAVISNTGIDLLGMGKGLYKGFAKLYNDDKNMLVVEADIEGYNFKKSYRRFLKTHLIYSNRTLSFPLIEFPSYNLLLDLSFSFTFSNFIDEMVSIYGSFYQNKQKIPIIGNVFFNNRERKIDSSLLIDNAFNFNSRNDGKAIYVDLSVANYDLSRIGLRGQLNFKFNLNYYNGLLNDINLSASYIYLNRNVKFIFRSKREEEWLNVNNFMLDVDADKLIGFGTLKQSEKHLSGRIKFARGGEINFSTDFNSIEGLIDIRNLFIKQFLKEDLDVFISTSLFFKGESILPDFYGSLKIINSAESKNFYLDAPYISRSGGMIQLKGIVLNMDNYNTKMDISLYYDSISNYTISGTGYLNLFNFFSVVGSFNYFYQNKHPSLIYNLKNISFSGRNITNIEGGAYFQDLTYFFYSRGNYGFNGFYKLKGDDKEWNLKFVDRNIQALSEGRIYTNNILSQFYFKIPLDILTSLKFLKDIKGELELKASISGRLESPRIDGSINFYQLNLSFENINTKIRNFNTELIVSNNRINFDNYLLFTTTGKFLVNGFVDLKSLLLPAFNISIQPYDRNPAYLSVNMYDSDLKLYGNIGIKKLNFNRETSATICSGDLTLDNFSIGIASFAGNEKNKKSQSLLNFIDWDIAVRVGNGVRFSNELMDLFLRKDDSVRLFGSIYKSNITVKGNLGIEKGRITYFGRDFLVKEGMASFDRVHGSILPYVKIDSYYRYKDEKGENVDVFLVFEGRVDNIALKSFDSVPKKDLNELYAVVGISPANTSHGGNSTSQTSGGPATSGVISAAENALIFSPLSSDLRRRFGLDMLSIKSGLIDNWSRRYILGYTNLGAIDLLEGSSLMLGKYIMPNMLVQYEFTLSRNPVSNQEVIPLHTFGLEFDFNLFDLDWKIQPYTELGRPVKYEQKIEFNINRRF